jgi:glucokinase
VILAGDIGGTNARLAFFEAEHGHLRLVSENAFRSADYQALDEIVARFVDANAPRIDAACFGIAGPVKSGTVTTPNLPWIVRAEDLAARISQSSVQLINDLEANAHGIAVLGPSDLHVVTPGELDSAGNRAVISAGTGLGEAGICRVGGHHIVFASEGGHCDFAPRDDLEVELLLYSRKKFEHVSYERILSGPGLYNVYCFLRDTGRGDEPAWLRDALQAGNPPAVISEAAMSGRSGLCEQALDRFISIYGAEAGNLALKLKATGGVYLGGGIAPKIATRLAGPNFLQAFRGKGRLRGLLEAIPVSIVTNDRAALLGAAYCAVTSLASLTASAATTVSG